MKYQVIAYNRQMDVSNIIAKYKGYNLDEMIEKVTKKAKATNCKRILIEVMREFAEECFEAINIYYL